MLGHFYPEIDPLKPPFINAVSVTDQWSLLEDLVAIHSKAMDDAVLSILQKVAAQPPADDLNDRFYQTALAYTCAKRLDDASGHGEKARASLEKMIGAFQKERKSQDAEGRAAFDKNIKYLGCAAGDKGQMTQRNQSKNLKRILVLGGLLMLANAYGETSGKPDELRVAAADQVPVNQAVTAVGNFAVDLYAQLARENPGPEPLLFALLDVQRVGADRRGRAWRDGEQMGKVLGFPEAARHMGNDAQLLRGTRR